MDTFTDFSILLQQALDTNDANYLHFIHICMHLRETSKLIETLEQFNDPRLRNLIRRLEFKFRCLLNRIEAFERDFNN